MHSAATFARRQLSRRSMWLSLLQCACLVFVLSLLASLLVLSFFHRSSFLDIPLAHGRFASSPPRRIGLVIAHPDDESMFFVPVLHQIRVQGHSVSILCLSTGNADGLGAVRSAELRDAAALLGVPSERVHLVDDETHLADGMHTRWSVVEARKHIEQFVHDERIQTLLTFDAGGISGHPNHVATFDAVQSYLRVQLQPTGAQRVDGYSLLSTPMWRKYAGVADGLLSAYEQWSSASSNPLSRVYLLTSLWPARSHQAMAAHASQFVWYRRLFVLFSRYTFVNTLARIDDGFVERKTPRTTTHHEL